MKSITHVTDGTSHVENSLGELCIFWNEEQRTLNKPQVILIDDQCTLKEIQCTLYKVTSFKTECLISHNGNFETLMTISSRMTINRCPKIEEK